MVGIQAVPIYAASLVLTAALLLGFGGLAALRKRAAARVKALMAAAMAVVSGCRRKAYAAPDTRRFALVNEGNPFVALRPPSGRP